MQKKILDGQKLSQDKSGQRADFEMIYDTYHILLGQIAYDIVSNKEAVKDIVQDAYLSFMNVSVKNQAFPSDIKYYLVASVKNASFAYLKSHKEFDFDLLDEESAATYDEDVFEENEQIRKILAVLNPQEKKILIMSIYDELKPKEIAQILHRSRGYVTGSLSRAKKKARKAVEENE
jgi:RNA polymerase sigma-70 factor (ECF subfamily)